MPLAGILNTIIILLSLTIYIIFASTGKISRDSSNFPDSLPLRYNNKIKNLISGEKEKSWNNFRSKLYVDDNSLGHVKIIIIIILPSQTLLLLLKLLIPTEIKL